NKNFGYIHTDLGDYVWYDTDHDGIQEPEEKGIAGVTVRLYDSTGTTILATTQTDGSGFYSFSNIDVGSYVVGFVTPAGYQFTTQDVGGNTGISDGFDSDANTGTGKTAAVSVTGVHVTVDAGMYISGADP